jgi:octaprenyl-diphosphate synthase
MISINDIKLPIKDEMKEFEKRFQTSLNTKVALLNIITKYVLRRKGKQMRPMFVLLSAKMLGTISNSTYVAASLIELLHTASLIHDDVVDESYERRNHFSINALWKSKIAVLMGDYLLAQGLLISVNNNEYELLKIVSNAVKEMSEGELMQIHKARKLNITEEEYFEIIRKKTASLIAACTACGAKASQMEDDTVERMHLFGEKVGVAFQIKDDLFDYTSNNSIGKPLGNDIKEKKLTLPLIHALQKANKQKRKEILKLINNIKNNKESVQQIIDFVKENKGEIYATEMMEKYKNEAIELLKDFQESDSKNSLIQLVEFTTTRKK